MELKQIQQDRDGILADATSVGGGVSAPCAEVPGWDVWAAFSRAQDLIEAIAQGGCDAPQIAAHSASAELREVRAFLANTPGAKEV